MKPICKIIVHYLYNLLPNLYWYKCQHDSLVTMNSRLNMTHLSTAPKQRNPKCKRPLFLSCHTISTDQNDILLFLAKSYPMCWFIQHVHFCKSAVLQCKKYHLSTFLTIKLIRKPSSVILPHCRNVAAKTSLTANSTLVSLEGKEFQ